MTLIVNTIYLLYRFQTGIDGASFNYENGRFFISSIIPDGPADKAGLRTGDIILSIDTLNLSKTPGSFNYYDYYKSGDTLTFKISRNKFGIYKRIVLSSLVSEVPGFYQTLYILILIFTILSLYLLYKKQGDPAVRIFFIYLQLFAISVNGRHLWFPESLANVAEFAFLLSCCPLGALLIHFHLLFPRSAPVYLKYRRLPLFFYVISGVVSIFYFVNYLLFVYYPSLEDVESSLAVFTIAEKIGLSWMAASFTIALSVIIYQSVTIKNTLARNQLLIVMTGSLFAFLTPITLLMFYNKIFQVQDKYNYILDLSNGICSLIMICCILIAIFRFRIWDIEVFIRKALLYLGATAIIILSYLFLIWFVDRFISQETNLTRFVILAISVILFLVIRDRLQRLIDRLFHRESYDSATVVSDFEANLAGIYRFDELKEKIVQSIDGIFHFKSFVFSLKKYGLVYEPAFAIGTDNSVPGPVYEINPELEERLLKAKVFSPEELSKKPPILEETNGELIVPLVEDGQANGFFLCGQKRSERIYSRQDIQVLRLLAQRVVSLLHTAGLYQKDLDRQLMLERERTRISQDMHDDVGASLTRISILSELAKNKAETDRESKQWLEQISSTSRSVTEEMSQIIWALNPKNDTLEGLIAYIRRFANEYLEPTSIHCSFELPEIIPHIPLSVEVRRNIYLVVREALHNVVKHSGATEVVIALSPSLPATPMTSPLRLSRYDNDLPPLPPLLEGEGAKGERSFTLSIRDNGKGFDPDKLEFPGNGLVNMKKRMEDVGGRLAIESRPDNGTVIRIEIGIWFNNME